MFTVCPKCTLTLVVTTVDLRAGQGYVRCGRCANVFNALIALREGDPSSGTSDTAKRRLLETAPRNIEPALGSGVAIEPEPEREPEPEPALEPEPEPEAEPEITLDYEQLTESAEAAPEEISLEFDASATDVSEIFISPPEAEHDTGSGNYEAVVLSEESDAMPPEAANEAAGGSGEHAALEHTDSFVADEWSLLDDEPATNSAAADSESIIEESPLAESFESEAPRTTQPDEPWVQEMFAEAEAQAEAKRSRTGERATFAAVEIAAPEFLEAEPQVESDAESPPDEAQPEELKRDAGDAAALLTWRKPQRPAWQPIAGAAALALLLVLQILHQNRQSLALSPAFGSLASTVYGWFGVTLVPRWDLTAYSVKQLGAEAEGGEGNRLRVRLSLQNESARVQPLPLLRLTLQDRYGNAVATRDLEPKDYLPKRVAEQRLLEPDQRIDAELHVIDPGKAAIGFEIDACLRAETGSIGCANEARRKAAG
ncbi:MAG: DUF3426 domain-containing protein [Steroidobacteraceae bacterium]|nr:DUF3426 domain-containing protein [Steroidobacteraceae bacterium]